MNEILIKYKDYLLARKQSMNYFNITKIWLEYLDTHKIDMNNITQEIITNFFNDKKEYSINTRNQFIKAGRSFDEFLGKQDSEWTKIRLIQPEIRITEVLTPKDIEEAKKYLKTYHSQQYSIAKIEALLSFLFATGIRKAELLNLKRSDFILTENKAKVFGKGRKERYIYFNDRVKKEVEVYFNSELEKDNAFNVSLGQLHYMVKLISKYLNKKVYMHLLRHSGATDMMNKEIPINMVSKILGHTNIQTTMRYLNPTQQMIADKYKEKMKDKK